MTLNLKDSRSDPGAFSDPDSVDLLALARTLWRGRLVILAMTTAAILAGGVYAFVVATPVYRATSVVMLETREGSVAGLDSVLGGLAADTSAVNTEVEVLRGRTLMGRVVDELGLTGDAEFNAALRPVDLVAGLRATIMGGVAAPQSPEEEAATNRAATISALLESVAVRNVPNSLVFQITVQSPSAGKAASIADTIARLYIDDQLKVRFDATEVATAWLATRVAELRVAFENADARVRDFRNATSLIDAETLAGMDRQLKETRRRLQQISEQVVAKEDVLARMAALRDPVDRAAATGDEALMRLVGRVHSGEAGAEAQLLTDLGRFQVQTQQDRDRLALQVQSLGEAEKSLSADIERQSQDLAELEILERESEASRVLYEHFQTRLNETSAQQGIQKADSRILSDAVVPSAPSAPRKSLVLAMAALLGLMLGAAIVLLRETMANRIRTSRELEELTGRAVLAQVPLIREKTRKGVLAYLVNKPTSAMAEAVRNLRTGILLSSVDRSPRVIVMTSALPGEGKTTTTLALAQNLTAMGRKVLVIEGDVRICSLGLYFDDLPADYPGVAAVINGDHGLAEAVVPIAGYGDLLFGRKVAVNAADLFSSQRFAALIEEARASYDIVLIDTPPVLVVPDARVIAQQADTVVFSVHWDSTSRTQIQEALHQLEMVNIRIAGISLNRVDPKGMRKYGYGGKHAGYGGYASYGSKYYGN